MQLRTPLCWAGLALASLGLASPALAGGRTPGSLLLFPEFETRMGEVTVVTVTNALAADVTAEFKYIGVRGFNNLPLGCEEFNRNEDLTGQDTLTLIANAHNPNQVQGYLYVFAKDGSGPVVHNGLIGNLLIVSGIANFEYSMNAVAFEGLADGDVNGNGLRDLDGTEYEAAPDEILIPRFFGQGPLFNSSLILIGLAGGARFDTSVDLLIYNDNEEVFSAEYTFRCWDRVPLLDISGIFGQGFLALFTNQDPTEVLGANFVESGWFSVWGALANSPTTTIPEPAIYAVLVGGSVGVTVNFGEDEERAVDVADLPWERGQNLTGKLLARSNDGQF